MVVAKRYGVSEVTLAKACRKLAVPLPPRGYWARIRAGRTLPRPPLPPYERPLKIQTTRRAPRRSAGAMTSKVPDVKLGHGPATSTSKVTETSGSNSRKESEAADKKRNRGRPRERKSRNTFIAPSMAGSERSASVSTVSARSRDSLERKAGTTNGTIYRFLEPSDITTSLVREGEEPVSASSYAFTRRMSRERNGGKIQRPSVGCGRRRDDCSGLFAFQRTRSIHSFPAWPQTTSRNSYSGSFECIIDAGKYMESNSTPKRRRWKTCWSRSARSIGES